MNQRGQGLSTNAIILIILGLVVLVMLILGFTMGWNKLLPFLSKDNVDQVISSCEQACITSSQYSYCAQHRELIMNGEKEVVTCNLLSVKNLGFEKCSKITCPADAPEGGMNLG